MNGIIDCGRLCCWWYQAHLKTKWSSCSMTRCLADTSVVRRQWRRSSKEHTAMGCQLMCVSMLQPADSAPWTRDLHKHSVLHYKITKQDILVSGCIWICWGNFVKVIRGTNTYWWSLISSVGGWKWFLYQCKMRSLLPRHFWVLHRSFWSALVCPYRSREELW